MSSSPAIIRSKVDLPEPDGPTKTTNSPASIVRSTPVTTFMSSPNDLSIPRKVTALMLVSSAFDRAGGEALDEVALAREERDQHRQRRHRTGGHHQVVAVLELVDEEPDPDR